MKSNFKAAQQFVDFGLSEQEKGRRESASGPGSSMRATQEARQFILSAIQEYDIRSIVDLGCGDWNWMRHIMNSEQAPSVSYTGWDVHAEMIEAHIENFGTSRINFEVKDIFTEPIPECDLVICRDVLFHVDLELASELIKRIEAAPVRMFMSTTYPDEPENKNIATYLPIDGWGFHRINLARPPFDIESKLVRTREEPLCGHQGKRRQVCLYDFSGTKA